MTQLAAIPAADHTARPERGTSTLPPVTAIVATRDRPELLARAIRSILRQDYRGELDVVVVFDQVEPTDVEVADPRHQLHLITNTRTPGLPGARNCGIAAATGDLIAFCDDDDEWLPGKITAQVQRLAQRPDAAACATGMELQTHTSVVERIPPATVVHGMLLRDRIQDIHPSSLMLRRADLLGGIGLVDEDLPGGYGEDYDLLLRASAAGAIVSVRRPLTIVHWDRPSFFTGRWDNVSRGLTYLLDKHPGLAANRSGRAYLQGQIAFAHSACGRGRVALRWARRSITADPREPRGYLATAVALKVLPAPRLIDWLNAMGKGI